MLDFDLDKKMSCFAVPQNPFCSKLVFWLVEVSKRKSQANELRFEIADLVNWRTQIDDTDLHWA